MTLAADVKLGPYDPPSLADAPAPPERPRRREGASYGEIHS